MTMQNPIYGGSGPTDYWADILGGSPRETYFSFGDQFGGRTAFGRGQRQRNYFQNEFQPIFDEFTGQVAQNIRGGQDPYQQQSFQEFLGEFPFSQRFASLPPSMRGGQRGRFAPQAAFRF